MEQEASYSKNKLLIVSINKIEFNSIEEALAKSYSNIDKIHFDKMNYRRDIGFDLT